MCLGRKVHDRVEAGGPDVVHCVVIGNVGGDVAVSDMGCGLFQIIERSGVGETVDIGDVVIRTMPQPGPHKVRTQKSASAGHQDSHESYPVLADQRRQSWGMLLS